MADKNITPLIARHNLAVAVKKCINMPPIVRRGMRQEVKDLLDAAQQVLMFKPEPQIVKVVETRTEYVYPIIDRHEMGD